MSKLVPVVAAGVVLGLATACGGAGSNAVDPESPPVPLAVIRVTVPPVPTGVIPLQINIAGAADANVAIAAEFSRDGGASWSSARLRNTSLGGRKRAGQFDLAWASLADLGFRRSEPVMLRIRAAAGDGRVASFELTTPPIDNRRAALHQAEDFAAYYGPLDDVSIGKLQTYDLVVVHPAPDAAAPAATRAMIAAIQDGVDPQDLRDDVVVLCYVAAGEDLRTARLGESGFEQDGSRFRGDGTGPRVDPRGAEAYRMSLPLDGIDPAGVASPGGGGFASWYLDDASNAQGAADGIPDRNPVYGAAYVNLGDPAWFETLDSMSAAQGDPPGLREVLTSSDSTALGCDGVFLDAFDVTAPNSYGATAFEWTAPGALAFLQRLRSRYPDALVMQNRGLFFFNRELPHFAFSTRGLVDAVLFESYRLDANAGAFFSPAAVCDNKRNFMPKLRAEASRPDGFAIFSLGYAEGPADEASGASLKDTLMGRGDYGLDTLLQDIVEAESIAGFRHYITDASVTLLNDFVRTRRGAAGAVRPQWTSTFNDRSCTDPEPSISPTPRVGLIEASPVSGGVRVRWDVALDRDPVQYVLYHQVEAFDFSASDPFARAEAVPLKPALNPAYADASAVAPLPFEAVVSGLPAGQPRHFVLRAVSELDKQRAESNQVVRMVAPLD